MTDEELIKVEILFNNRSRKVLNFAIPIEAFDQLERFSANSLGNH